MNENTFRLSWDIFFLIHNKQNKSTNSLIVKKIMKQYQLYNVECFNSPCQELRELFIQCQK